MSDIIKAYTCYNKNWDWETLLECGMDIFHGHSKGEAKQKFLKTCTDNTTYLDVVAKRCKEGDLYLFEGEYKYKHDIDSIIKQRNREDTISKLNDTDLFYIQHVRCYIDDMLFFEKGCNGYTRDIDNAHIFTGAEIKARSWRDKDIIWHKEDIDVGISRVVKFEKTNNKNKI